MSAATYSEHNRALLAWGAQRLVSDLGTSGDGPANSKEKRQLSDFYGDDEPSLNSFIYAGRPLPGRPVAGLARPAQRCVSHYDRAYSRPRALARTRRQPATMPAASFAEMADGDVVDRQASALPQPKVARSDSLLSRARRVLSLPSGRRARRFAAGVGALPTHDGFERQERPEHPSGRSHFSHSSRRAAPVLQTDEADMAGLVHEIAPAQPSTLEERIKFLEAELEAQKVRNDRQQQRLEELEKEIQMKEETIPALDSIIQTAMNTFEAKETALKRTIATLDRDFTNAMEEKNETIRLFGSYDSTDRRNRASPPGSTSTVSESGTEGSGHYLQVARRVQSLDTHRRSGSPSSRSLFTNIEFDINR